MVRAFSKVVGVAWLKPLPPPLVVTYMLLQTGAAGGGLRVITDVAGKLGQPIASKAVTV
jgi:hypothetical protein